MKAADIIILALKNTGLSDFQEDHHEFFSSTLLFINIPMEKALSHFRFNMEGKTNLAWSPSFSILALEVENKNTQV